MPINVYEDEIQRLARFYRKAVQDLAGSFVSGLDFQDWRTFTLIQGTQTILDELEKKTARWAKKNIVALYKRASNEAGKTIRQRAKLMRRTGRSKVFAVINQRAIEMLLLDPEVGFLPNISDAVEQVRNRLVHIRNQAKILQSHQRVFDEVIARVGILEGHSIGTVRDQIVNELVKLRRGSSLVWTKKAAALPNSEIISNVANLPLVKIPNDSAAKGYSQVRIDHYAEMLARTKSAQATNLARRNKAFQHGIELVQISPNKPLLDDACWLYIGRVFALTPSAKEEYGIPLVSELPNGGAPFHPNCTHQELIFSSEFATTKEKELGFISPPKWALNKPWGVVNREWRRRGGLAAARAGRSTRRWNPAAEEYGRSTGGRERRRREAGLSPDE